MKFLRLFLCLVTFTLTACMSHLFIDTSTRLQVENKTDVTILGLDIVSDDGSSVSPWIRDTIEPGEKSRVFEEDWVGKFRVRVRFDKWDKYEKMIAVLCITDTRDVKVRGLKKQSEVGVTQRDAGSGCDGEGEQTYAELELDFEGGSQYLVVSQDDDGNVVFKFK